MHVLTDQKGIPLSAAITAAKKHDMKAAVEMLDGIVVKRQHLCLDRGYNFQNIEREVVKTECV